MSAGCVYLVQCGDEFKIGWSTNLRLRLRELQKNRRPRLRVIHLIEATNPEGLEAWLHLRFVHARIGGSEWFQLTTDEVEEILQTDPRLELPQLRCQWCQHQWWPRFCPTPDMCPRCQAKDWDEPRRQLDLFP
jgi:predicted Zn-ribbon and HTH transcriptional regulator